MGNILSQIISSFPSGFGSGQVIPVAKNSIFILMMPAGITLTVQGAVSCASLTNLGGFTGYHSPTTVNGQTTSFIAIPWCDSNTTPSTADYGYAGLTRTLSHELVECITDPDGTSGWHNGTCELCDFCELPGNTVTSQFPIQNPGILPADFLSNWANQVPPSWEVSDYFSNTAGTCVAPVPGPPQPVNLRFTPQPIAQPGSLSQGQQVPLTFYASDKFGKPTAGTPITLQFFQQSVGATMTANGVTVTAAGIQANTDQNGEITITYAAPAPVNIGVDTLYASLPGNPGAGVSTSYQFFPLQISPGSFDFNPNPIAAAGSLAAGQVVPITFVATQPGGQPWASVTLSLDNGSAGPAYGTAVVTDATGVPFQMTGAQSQSFTPDKNGIINIQYTAPSATAVAGRSDFISASVPTGQGSLYADTGYIITPQGGPLATLSFSPSPIAATGSLQAWSWVPITLTATDASGLALANTFVGLFFGNVGPSGRTSGSGAAQVNGASLPIGPGLFETDSNGTIKINYQAPYQLPPGGVDTITAQDQLFSPSVVATDTYGGTPHFIVILRNFFTDLLNFFRAYF
jgi:hypothetical protein